MLASELLDFDENSSFDDSDSDESCEGKFNFVWNLTDEPDFQSDSEGQTHFRLMWKAIIQRNYVCFS